MTDLKLERLVDTSCERRQVSGVKQWQANRRTPGWVLRWERRRELPQEFWRDTWRSGSPSESRSGWLSALVFARQRLTARSVPHTSGSTKRNVLRRKREVSKRERSSPWHYWSEFRPWYGRTSMT